MTVNENVSFTDYPSGIRPLNSSKLAINCINSNGVTNCWHDVIVIFFKYFFISPVKFSYWSKFYANIITSSGVMTIYFYKRLTRNPEIGNTPIWTLPNIWRIWQVRGIQFGTNVPNKSLLNAAKYHDYSFYRFWVIREKPTGRSKTNLPSPPSSLIFYGKAYIHRVPICGHCGKCPLLYARYIKVFQ